MFRHEVKPVSMLIGGGIGLDLSLYIYITVEATSCRPRIFPREEERGETKGWRIGYARCRVELADDYSNLLRNVRGAGDAS